jgi:hypothetical protein
MRYFTFLLICAFLISCGNENPGASSSDSANTVIKEPDTEIGIASTISCKTDASNTYTVYLPTSYSKEKKRPVLIFFDAHANGSLPINKYRDLAEKWNCILIGSNSSKNGISPDLSLRIGDELMTDARNRFSIDETNILLCGFSGGARVAAAMALNRNDIKGVIGNSASPQAPLTQQIFIGLAGLGDMNYLEMRKFENSMAPNKQHALLVFEGKHEWAPSSAMENALLMCLLYDYKLNGVSKDSLMTKVLEENAISQADSLKDNGCMLSRDHLKTIHLFLESGGKLEQKYKSIENSACVKSDELAWKQAEKDESELQTYLGEALLSRDTSWWMGNVDVYFHPQKTTGANRFMRERLQGYMSLMCYTYSNQAFRMGNLHAAEKMTHVYGIIDPENSEWRYLRASLFMKLGIKEQVIPNLQNAIELGFNDKTRLQTDPIFEPIRNDAAFTELFGKMKS